MNFFHTILISLGVFLVCSFFGFAALPFISPVMFAVMIYLLFRSRPYLLRQDTLIGLGIFAAFASLATAWLNGVWVIPSNDDTINHLAFLKDILDSKNVLLGKIPRPGGIFFGEIANHFYPTGAHGIAALFIHPFQLMGLDWVAATKIFVIVTLGLWPALLWASSIFAFPNISRALRFFMVISAATLPAFPLWTLGEGGFTRILALTLFVPLWFSKVQGFTWGAIYAPLLLFVHPCLLPLIALKTLFFKRTYFLRALLGAILGAFFFFMILKSAQQEVTSSEFANSLLVGLRTDAFGWFDRLKGPFHYWFSDPDGFGKFLSPKNWLIYTGVVLAFRRKVPIPVAVLFVAPFALAALALIPNPIALQLGVIFYHSTKRIAELTPFLGFVIACFTAEWLTRSNRFKPVHQKVAVGFSILFLMIFGLKSGKELEKYHDLYQSPKTAWVNEITSKVSTLPMNAVILIDQHEFDFLRFSSNHETYTLRPECMEVGTPSSYCENRKTLPKKILAGESINSHSKTIWWLPGTTEDAGALEQAKFKNKNVIELSPHAHLVQLI